MHVLLLETIALVGGTVHTMVPVDGAPTGIGPAPIVATVLIEDGRIEAVGADLKVPRRAKVIDVAGLHIVPGLIDASVTFDAEHDALYLAAGVTTVRDNGSPIAAMVKEASGSMRDRNPGPSLLVPSPVFADAGATRPDAFLLADPAQAIRQIDQVLELLGEAGGRIDYFVIDRAIDAQRHAVVCGEAKQYGVDVWGPLPQGMAAPNAREQGQRGMVGLDSLLPRGFRFDTLKNPDILNGAVASMGEGGWRVVPLLMGTARIVRAIESDGEPVVLSALGGAYETAWRADLESFAMIEASGGLAPVGKSLGRQRNLAKQLADAGVQLVPGSGAPSGGIAPGSGLIDELEEWSLAGVPAATILDLATRGAADALGLEDRGQVAAGRVADLIVLGSDPRRSVSALRNPEIVISRGKIRERFDLDDAVAALVARQAKIRAQRARPMAVPRPPMPEGEVLVDGAAELMAYGSRSATERYMVVQLEDGRRAYGARVHVLATGSSPAHELIVVQIIEGSLVESFDLTLDALDESGKPMLGENGEHAFLARGKRAPDSKKLSIERFRFNTRIDIKRAEEAIAAVDGSSVLVGLIAAREFPSGASFIAAFDGLAMEPLVDRVTMTISPTDGRIGMTDTRGARVYGFGPGGELLFAARGQAGGRYDVEPSVIVGGESTFALKLSEGRVFTGDPERWAETSDAASAGPAESAGQSESGGGDK